MNGREGYMAKAIKEAYNGIEHGHGGPFGAVIVRGDRVIASAHNRVLIDNDPTCHAEIRAISEAARRERRFDLSGCEIFSTTEPCPMCFSAIHWARIDRLYYGTSLFDASSLGFNELTVPSSALKEMGGAPVEIVPGYMLEDCVDLLRYWEALPDKGVY